MRTQDTFLGFWNENQECSSVDRRKPAGNREPQTSPRHPRCGACNRQKKKGIVVKAQVQPNQACGSSCRYTDGCVFIIARFSNTSDFLLQKKYGCSRAGCYPVEEILHEEDGSSDAGNSGASKRSVNLFLCRRRSSDTHVLAGALQRELICRLRRAQNCLWAVWFASSLPVRPMNFSPLATSVFGSLPLAMQCVIAVVMLRRGLVRQFPFFFSYTVLLPARDAVLYFLPQSGNLYSTVFWWGDGVAIVLALAVVFETSFAFHPALSVPYDFS